MRMLNERFPASFFFERDPTPTPNLIPRSSPLFRGNPPGRHFSAITFSSHPQCESKGCVQYCLYPSLRTIFLKSRFGIPHLQMADLLPPFKVQPPPTMLHTIFPPSFTVLSQVRMHPNKTPLMTVFFLFKGQRALSPRFARTAHVCSILSPMLQKCSDLVHWAPPFIFSHKERSRPFTPLPIKFNCGFLSYFSCFC